MTSAGESRTLAGRYRLGDVIGRGGMSTVYRATDLSLDRIVAVKVALEPLVEREPIYVARFTREARAAAAINHPGVVTVYDAGADGPTLYIVMEYVAGRSLDQVLRDEHPLEPARAVRIARDIADVLSAAHAAGIVHRDIKPGNVMITDDGTVKVLDFGIARALDSGTLTRTAVVLGTTPYMSPEQALGRTADARSDIYSLGCVLYEMLTGQAPFMAEVPAAVMNMHVNEPVTPPRERNPRVSPALDQLVVQMLAKSPEDRPQTAAEVRDRLDRAMTEPEEVAPAPDQPPTAATVALAGIAAETAATVPHRPPTERASAPATRPLPPPRPERSGGARRMFLTAVALIAALLVGGAVAIALSGGSGKSSSTSSRSSAPSTAPPASTTTITRSVTTSPTSSTSKTSTTTPKTSSTSKTSTTTPLSNTSSTAPTTTTTTSSTTPGAVTKVGTGTSITPINP